MGKIKTLQSSLNGGELTPKLSGRPELPRYQSGLEWCEGFIPFVLGGATSRPGLRFVAQAALDANGKNKLDVYTGLDDAGSFRGYCLESNNAQIRVFKAYASVDTFANLNTLQFDQKHIAQFEEYLYAVSADEEPTRCKKNSDADWFMETVPFVKQPFVRPAGTEAITITPSATSGNITLVASAAFFAAGHVGLQMIVNNGLVEITAVTNSTNASATVIEAIVDPAGVDSKTVRFNISYAPPETPVAFAFDCTAVASFTADTLSSTIPDPLPTGVQVTAYNSTVQLTGTTPDKDWKEQAWSDLRGWPIAVGFFEQRMILAGSRSYPTTVWGSKSGEPLDFTLGTDDNSAFAWKLASADTPIRSIFADDKIYVFTATKVISLDSGNEKPLSPTNFKIKTRATQGASHMAAVKSGPDLIFSSVSFKRLYSLVYRLTEDRFVPSDVTLYGEHLVREGGGIVQVAVTREPHPVIWCRTAAGSIVTLTYDTEQQVAAWARQSLDGVVTNMVTVPDDSGNDQIWISVLRNGQTNIEAFDWTLQTDSAVIGSDVVGKVEWTGLNHLEGKDVVAVADGYVVQNLVVQGGKVTLPFPAKSVEIGLPFTARLKDLPLGVPGSSATVAQAASLNEIRVLLHQTKGCKVNGERLPFQKFDEALLDQPVQSFTGWKKAGALGWGDFGVGGQVEIIRDLPLPCTVLAIVKEITVNG